MSLIDIIRILAILAFGMFSGWVIYRLMKSADVDEENEESKEQERKKNENKSRIKRY